MFIDRRVMSCTAAALRVETDKVSPSNDDDPKQPRKREATTNFEDQHATSRDSHWCALSTRFWWMHACMGGQVGR